LDRGLMIIPPFGSRCSVTSNYESTILFNHSLGNILFEAIRGSM